MSSMSAFAVKVVTDLDDPPLILCDKEQDFVDTQTGEVSRRPVPWAKRDYNKWVFREIAKDIANFLETLVSKTGEHLLDDYDQEDCRAKDHLPAGTRTPMDNDR